MTVMIPFGRTADGTLSKCTAKPENRGKGNCTHSTHFDLPADKADEILRKDEERKLERKYFKLVAITKRKEKKEAKEAEFKRREQEAFQEFNTPERLAAIEQLTEHYSSENFDYIDSFQKKFENFIKSDLSKSDEETELSIKEFLNGNSLAVKKIRAKFGDSYNASSITRLLTRPPNSMMRTQHKNNPKYSVSRIILSGIDNDMNKENYIKSVVFFGGKCCYCETPLKMDGSARDKATGEHLTPVSPEKSGSPKGSTRFGNMALCCPQCNHSRGNQNLESWIIRTTRIKKKRKPHTFAKIKAFRKFSGYQEFSQEFSQEVDKTIKFIEDTDEKLLKRKGIDYRYGEERKESLKALTKQATEKLREFPNKYES